MSITQFLEDDITETKNDIFISEFNLCDDHFIPIKPFKEELKDEKSSCSDSSMTKIIKNQFIKEMSDKNIISNILDSNEESQENNYISSNGKNSNPINFQNIDNNMQCFQCFSDGENISDFNERFICDLDNDEYNYQLALNLESNLSDSHSSPNIIDNNDSNGVSAKEIISINNNFPNKKKIFNVVKVPRYKEIRSLKCFKQKRNRRGKNKGKNNSIDWDNIPVPKEKHFHLDRKKKRIIFQRKYLKMIYSIVDLEYPFDFNMLFNLIKVHVGDKTVNNYGNGKSYHIIKINNELIVVNMKEKKMLLKGSNSKK